MAKRIDMESLTVQQLEEIRNEVLRNLALRQFGEGAQPVPIGPHDKHTSAHSKNTVELIEVGVQVLQPTRVPPSSGVTGQGGGIRE
jgi:hypothetical protein